MGARTAFGSLGQAGSRRTTRRKEPPAARGRRTDGARRAPARTPRDEGFPGRGPRRRWAGARRRDAVRVPVAHGAGRAWRGHAPLAGAPGEARPAMRGGSVAVAALAGAPSSTKDAEKARDPEARSARKGGVRRLGREARAGVGAGGGSAAVEAAACAAQVCSPPGPGGRARCVEAGRVGPAEREEAVGGPAPRRPASGRCAGARASPAGPAPSAPGSRRPLLVVKRRFGFAEARRRSPARAADALCAPSPLANLALVARAGRLPARAWRPAAGGVHPEASPGGSEPWGRPRSGARRR